MSFGGSFGGGALPDPYYLYPSQNIATGADRVKNIRGRTVVSPTLVGGESTAVIVVIGQSLSANCVNSGYTVLQSKNHNFDFQSGGCYASVEPLLGCNVSGGLNSGNTGHWAAEMADRLINAGTYARVILCPMAIGGTTVADWANSTTAPFLCTSIDVMGRRLTAAGLAATHVVWGQGENDAGTSQVNYTSRLNTVIARFRAAGMTCPFIVLRETMLNGVTDANVYAAQGAMTGTNVFVGYDMDTNVPNSGGNRYDGTHLASPGRALVAAGVQANIVAHP